MYGVDIISHVKTKKYKRSYVTPDPYSTSLLKLVISIHVTCSQEITHSKKLTRETHCFDRCVTGINDFIRPFKESWINT